MKCPDLESLTNYRIKNTVKGSRDPWDKVILCAKGHICPWGPEMIGCVLDTKSRKTRTRLAELGFDLWQDGEDGQNWVGPVSKLGSACRTMGARRKKVLSPEHKAKLQAGLKRSKSHGP